MTYSPTSRPLSTMKIFHALVGYLAVTALPFKFHPAGQFAFAYPLAATTIDYYDGYVNLNTTQIHTNGTLMKRHGVPAAGDDTSIIEERQLAVIVPAVGFILFVIADITLSIIWIEGDDPVGQ